MKFRKLKLKLRSLLKKIWRHKRISIAICTVAILIFCVGNWEQWAYKEFQIEYSKHFVNAEDVFRKAISEKDSKSVVEKIASLKNAQNKLSTESKKYCEIHSQIRWQNFFPEFRKTVNDCEQRKAKLTNLFKNLNGLIAYLEFEQLVSNILSDTNSKTNQSNQDAKFDAIEAYWNEAGSAVSKLSGSDKQRSLIIENVTKMAIAWKNVSDANVAKDKQQFEKARTELATAYNALSVIASSSNDEINRLTNILNESYRQIF